ncbi:hypothetical protein [Piscinibacter sakaiensis]|uniref:hypothetical protein n=1 Tax=Piscinibacter sakaiensis TaxID=1547922 RepID=UPI003AB04BDC
MTTSSYPGAVPAGFSVDRHDADECRRLRLAHHLTSEAMADVAMLPGRRAWMAIESGYEPISAECWKLCLLVLDEHPDYRSAESSDRVSRLT